MPAAISVENLGKRYSISRNADGASLRDTLSRGISSFCGRVRGPFGAFPPDAAPAEPFWALDGVSFQVTQGERVGIVGRNGAGKSTLLKILSRITEPTTGRARIRGRVASLLEVGSGFHPELTGRENIFLNGAILGMSREEIRGKFDEIVAFSEIDRFLDTPVKRYSSGMYVRLAFAVAAHLEPEILIVDEVLAVGDAEFQKKCLGKMKEVGSEGRTVLFVSHNMTAIRHLCGRSILLERGRVALDGPSQAVVEAYLRPWDAGSTGGGCSVEQQLARLPDDPVIEINDIRVFQEGEGDLLVTGKEINVEIGYHVKIAKANLRVFFDVLDDMGEPVFRSFHDSDASVADTLEAGRYLSKATIPRDLMAPLRYSLRVGATIYGERSCTGEHVRIPFQVHRNGRVNRCYSFEVYHGKIWPHIEWHTAKLPSAGRDPR